MRPVSTIPPRRPWALCTPLSALLLAASACSDHLGPATDVNATATIDAFAAASSFGSWSEPVDVGPTINDGFAAQQPTVSRDGLTMYFTSNRPEHDADATLDNNLWVAHRPCVECPWGQPELLAPPMNWPGNDANPNLSRDEHWLFFVSNRQPGGQGGNDIWVARREHVHDPMGWQPPANLGPGVNTSVNEAGPGFFENDDAGLPQLYFNRQSGPPNLPSGDIFVSQMAADGSWGTGTAVPELNTEGADQKPSPHPNGVVIYFWSDRSGDARIWFATRSRVGDPWSTPTMVPSPVADVLSSLPTIHSQGPVETLYFSRTVGTPPNARLAIFRSTRTRSGGAP